MFFQNKRVVVTGGTGFLGSHLVKRLREQGAKVAIPSRANWDLTSAADTRRFFAHHSPEYVFHCAAVVGGIGYNQAHGEAIGHENDVINENVLNACEKMMPTPKLITVGSVCAYPKVPKTIPFIESEMLDDEPEETNRAYGLSKRRMLKLGQMINHVNGVNIIHLVLANLYGEGDSFEDSKSHVIPALIKKFHAAKVTGAPSVVLWGTGEATRDFLYVGDAVDALLLAAEKYDSPEPINIGTGNEVSIKMLADLVSGVVGYFGDIQWDTSKPNGQPRRVLNTGKALRELEWGYKTSLGEGLSRVYDWYVENETPNHN